ncbi:WH2 domain-containing protein [Balamuthia mandrillaris]
MEVDLNTDLLDGIVIDEAPEGPAVAASSSAASSSSADALPVLPVGTITDQPFEFELREIKEEEEEEAEKKQKEEEEAAVEEEIPEEEEAEEEEKEKEKETEGTVEEEENDKGKGKEAAAPQESSEEKERRLKREKEAKALPPLQPLPAPAVNKIFERLPEEMRLSITDTDETPTDELPFQPREKSVNPPSKNERRVELSFPPPPTPPKTEEEMEKERKQQEKEELARRKKEQKEIEQLNKMAFMDDKQRLKAEEKMRKEKEKDEKKEKEKAAKAETSRMAAISNRSGQLDAKLKEAKQIAAQKAEEELRMLRTLTVTRYTPEGNQASVQLSQIVITFNHPLLPPPEKTEGEEEEEVDKEVKLDGSLLEWKPEIEPAPMVEGEWWVGGTSLVYRTPSGTPLDQCWARATEYKVTVPEGVQSKAGELPVLGEAFSFSFRTPTIKVGSTYPHHNATRISLRPLFFVCFDQIIDSKEEILQHIRLYIPPSGSPLKASYHDDPSIKEYASLHLLSEEEEKEELNRHRSVVRQPFDSNAEGRWMCLACDEALPHDKRVVLQIGPDLPSAEGPLRSKDCHVLSFQTVPPFVVTHYRHTGLVSGRQTLAITFNQDIIPSTSASFGFSDLPCLPYITPDPEEHNEAQGSSSSASSSSSSICAGTWSLSANNSLLYTPYRDWKKATEFTVTVPPDICGLYHAQLQPAKTTATPGGLCSKNLQWNFHTPTPLYTQTFPTSGLSNVLVNTPILVIFDQKIRPKKVIKRMSVWYEQKKLMMTNKKNVALQLVKSLEDLPSSAFSSEQEADRLKDMIEKAPEKQWVLATPAERLPFGTSCHLQLGPKLPSAEGSYADPDKIQHINFSTVSRFQVSYVQPGNKGYMTSPAGHVSVFFNHPLVRWKGTHDDLEWRFEISPELESEGTWSTPSSHELRFTPNSNWAGSTQYTITVPAGVKSYLGDELEEEYTTTFTTSVLAVTQYSYLHHASSASVGEIRDPPVWVCFNQIIDAEQVLKQISMTYSGSMFRSTSVPLRLMDYDEVMECEQAQHLISDQNEGYWLAFKPVEKLPFATDVTVTIGPDLPSAEGPLLSSHKTTFGFKTIPPFLCTSNVIPLL